MDPIASVVVACVFTGFGYVWRMFTKERQLSVADNVTVVDTTVTKLEKDGFLRTEIVNGQIHYIRWPDFNTNKLQD